MPFFVGCLALIFPRLALALVWLVGGDYVSRPYQSWVWPLLGFFFLPLTTLTFAFSSNTLEPPGAVGDFGWLLVVVALLGDLGLLGGGRSSAKRWREREHRD